MHCDEEQVRRDGGAVKDFERRTRSGVGCVGDWADLCALALCRLWSLTAMESVCCLLGQRKSNGGKRAGPYFVAVHSPGQSRGAAVVQEGWNLDLKEMKESVRRQQSAQGNGRSDWDLSDRGVRWEMVKLARALTGSASPRRGSPVAAVVVAAVAAAGRSCPMCAGTMGSGLSEASASGAYRPCSAGQVVDPSEHHFETLRVAVDREQRMAADPTRSCVVFWCWCWCWCLPCASDPFGLVGSDFRDPHGNHNRNLPLHADALQTSFPSISSALHDLPIRPSSWRPLFLSHSPQLFPFGC